PPSCIPVEYFFYLDRGQIEYELAAQRHATAIFSGWGGDALFFQARAQYGPEDYLRTHRWTSHLWTIALDAAHVDRLSLWAVLYRALRARANGKPWSVTSEFGCNPTLVRAEIIHAAKQDASFVHPWFHAPSAVTNGKLFHAEHLIHPYSFYHALGSDTDP